MSIPISKLNCDYCHNKLTDWDYRYKGKHYCKKCYNYLFHFKICVQCKKRRKIYYALKVPICKFCQVKDMPCIRCGKKEYTFGKITEYGSVCNSCAKYFTRHTECIECKKIKSSVSNRNLQDGRTKLLCSNCYAKTLPVCCSCGYRTKAHCYDINKKRALCKACSIEITRACTKCKKDFPAGFGRICSECHFSKALAKKTDFISNSLSSHMSNYFKEFSSWLKDRRGVHYASFRLQYYYPYFFELDNFCEELNRLPTYEEIANKFTIAITRKYLSVTIFFNTRRLIKINKVTKEKYANIDMINKYLITFEKDTYYYILIHTYHKKLCLKLDNNKTTIRSIRLALTPAVKFLKYCNNFKENRPNMDMLNGYLWCYFGQKASITGFINFLITNFQLKLSMKDVKRIFLERPNTSKAQRKQKFINLLRSDKKLINEKYLLKLTIEYLHDIKIKDNIHIYMKDIKIDKSNNYYIKLAGKLFYLPNEIFSF